MPLAPEAFPLVVKGTLLSAFQGSDVPYQMTRPQPPIDLRLLVRLREFSDALRAAEVNPVELPTVPISDMRENKKVSTVGRASLAITLL